MISDNSNTDGVDDQSAYEHDNHATEIQNVVTETGASLYVGAPPDTNTHQLGQAITDHSIRVQYFTDSGVSGTQYTLTMAFTTVQNPTAVAVGMMIAFVPNYTNTTNNPSVNVAGLGNKSFRRASGGRIRAGDIQAGHLCQAVYGGTYFWLLNHRVEEEPRGYIDGLLHANESVAPLTTVEIEWGGCRDSSNSVWMYDYAAPNKKKLIDTVWAYGNTGGYPSTLNVGGAGAGVVAADTWYRFFLLWRDDDGIRADAGWDTSATAANLLADATDYTHYRQFAWHLTDGSADIIPYIQDTERADVVIWDVPHPDLTNHVIPGTGSREAITVGAPPGSTAIMLLSWKNPAGAGGALYGLATQTGQTDTAASVSVWNFQGLADADTPHTVVQRLEIPVDSNSQIHLRYSSTLGTIDLSTQGFIYRRGKQ